VKQRRNADFTDDVDWIIRENPRHPCAIRLLTNLENPMQIQEETKSHEPIICTGFDAANPRSSAVPFIHAT